MKAKVTWFAYDFLHTKPIAGKNVVSGLIVLDAMLQSW